MMIWRRLPYSLLLLGLLSGCSWFDSKDEEVIKGNSSATIKVS